MKKNIYLLAIVFGLNCYSQDTVFVTSIGDPFSSIENHNSWANATNNIQDAIYALSEANGGQIWVVADNYYPTDTIPGTMASGLSGSDSLRMTSFILKDNVYLYGGFLGIEERLDQRLKHDLNENDSIEPWEYTYPTVLSGNINDIADSSDNCFLVVYGTGTSKDTCLLEGFTITAGNSLTKPNELIVSKGAGALGANLKNCILSRNNCYLHGGAAAYCVISQSLIIQNTSRLSGGGCTFTNLYYSVIRNNTSDISGGGCELSNLYSCIVDSNISVNRGGGVSHGYIENCIISSNECLGMGSNSGFGGGITGTNGINSLLINNKSLHGGGAGDGFHPLLINCIITNNYADSYGGTARYNLINCIVTNNDANNIGGSGDHLYNDVYNTIFWGNSHDQVATDRTDITYCAVQGGSEGENIIDLDFDNFLGPMFTSPSDSVGIVKTKEGLEHIMKADWSLLGESPCIDSGSIAFVHDSITTDYLGQYRIMGTSVDIGAIEFPDDPYIPSSLLADIKYNNSIVKVYPTLTANKVYVTCETAKIVKIELFSITGQYQSSIEPYSKITEISLDRYKNGTYFVRVLLDDQNTVTKSIIKME